jgi:hypothetical protein
MIYVTWNRTHLCEQHFQQQHVVQEVTLAGLPGPEYEDNAIIRNVGNYSAKDTVSQSNNIALENP